MRFSIILILLFFIGQHCSHTGSVSSPSQKTDQWVYINSNNQPHPRTFHTSVLLDNKVWIWGGISDESLTYPPVVNTGMSFDLATHTWQKLTTVNAPQARHNHTMIGLSDKFLVWGGTNNKNQILSDGYLYNIKSHTWTKIENQGFLSPRKDHTSTSQGSLAAIWGGRSEATKFADGGIFDSSTNQWTEIKPPKTKRFEARVSHSMVWADDEIIIWGGFDSRGRSNTGWRYNLTKKNWTSIPPQDGPTPRNRHCAFWINKKMYIWGGITNSGHSADFFAYDPKTNFWENLSSMPNQPEPRSSQSCSMHEGNLVIWGGRNSSLDYLNTGAIFNASEKKWTTINIPLSPRMDSTFLTFDHSIFIWGGFGFPSNDVKGKQETLNDGGIWRYLQNSDAKR